MKYFQIVLAIFLFASLSCTKQHQFSTNFNNTNDRVWVGKDFWSVPLEDWKVENGKLHCVGEIPDSRVNILTHVLSPESGNFKASVKVVLSEKGETPGTAGFLLGIHDKEDPDVRAACYFGTIIKAGISLNGFAFLKDKKVELPGDFEYSDFNIVVEGNNSSLAMLVTDVNGLRIDLKTEIDGIRGLIAIANNLRWGDNDKPGKSKFIFDDFHLSGSKVIEKPENSFGPILWTMHTLSKKTLKLMALLPPIGEQDNQSVALQFKRNEKWETVATEEIEPDSRTAIFRFDNWDDTKNTEYRVEYVETGKDGTETLNYYKGTIRKDPVDKPLKFGGLTCQYHFGFPYSPLVENLEKLNPDMLYFSGDQIYEGNGGYGIKRTPAEDAILNYLGKYYMFGWAFGDLMRDRPTICTPDDHDVFHGNLWGEGGKAKPKDGGESDTRGFIEPVKMVNVVNRTQCGQLPDPYDSTPIEQGMTVWYTDLTYGKVSFAVISDRVFKTGPEAVSDWEGRHDHMKEGRKDLSFLDKKGVKMLGDRQIKFLNDWKMDWEGANIKVLLSQTVFANVATHHGSLQNYLYGDLDSGGWPKSGRDKVIEIMKSIGALNINGDQHLPTLVQYGLNDYRDANWSFCTPAIATMYLRWFLPDEMSEPVYDRPDHGYPNTGKYTDAFGNKNFVYAVGNPGKNTVDRDSRYTHAQIRSSGFGMVTFDQKTRDITLDAWRFIAEIDNPNPVRDQFPGWPLQINQYDNFGLGANHFLPEFVVNKPDEVIEISNVKSGKIEYIFRMKQESIQPKMFKTGTYSVKIANKEIGTFKTKKGNNTESIKVEI